MRADSNHLGKLLAGLFAFLIGVASPLAQPGPRGPGGPGGGPGGPGSGGFPLGGINPAGMAQSAINTQLQQLTQSFNRNDRNRDGRMNQPEFSQMFQSGAFRGIQNRIPSPPGGNQGMANQIFQQLGGRRGSFDLNQLLGFANKLMGGPQSKSPQQGGMKSPFKLPGGLKPPFQLPKFPPFNASYSTNSSDTNNTASTNASSSGSSGSSAEMSLGYAMSEGYVTVKFGSSDRRDPESNLRLKVSRTSKASDRDIKLALRAGAILSPTRKSYSQVKINGFSDVYPRMFTLPKSSDSNYWDINAKRLSQTRRLPFGYIDFSLSEGN